MSRSVISYATEQYHHGQDRLFTVLDHMEECAHFYHNIDGPSHNERPFAFKALCLHDTSANFAGFPVLLWCDSCILPIRSLEPVWAKIERDGYLIMRNGWTNYEWTADSAYPDLFPEWFSTDAQPICSREDAMTFAREQNKSIPHVVAGFFGIDLRREVGRKILDEYYRLASQTTAFCGPTWNLNHSQHNRMAGAAPCGPDDVRGHRHDQTALSVIAWRLGCKLTDAPEFFAYPPSGWNRERPTEGVDERTCVLADGGY